MAIYIFKNNHKYGPYEESAVRRWLQTGECSPNELAWHDGMREWQQLGMILPPQIEPSLPPALNSKVNSVERKPMKWYYIEGNQQRGPVEPQDLQRLAATDVIRVDTLIWQEGMTNWQSYGSIFSSRPATSSLPMRDAPTTQTPLPAPPFTQPVLQKGQRNGSANVIRGIVITGLGITTGIFCAVILFLLEVYAFSLHSFIFFFVIPVGAMLSGFAASGGYLAGARLLNYRPRRSVLFCAFVIPLLTYFLIHGFEYLGSEIDGRWAPEVFSFGGYLDRMIRGYSLSFFSKRGSSGTSGSLGSWGYVVEIVYTLGFILGGSLLHSVLNGIPHCLNCRRRLVKKSDTISVRYASEQAEIESVLATVSDLLSKGDDEGAWAKHSEQTDKSHLIEGMHSMANLGSTSKLPFRFMLMRWICSYCSIVCFTGKVEKLKFGDKGDRSWQSVKDFRRYVTE